MSLSWDVRTVLASTGPFPLSEPDVPDAASGPSQSSTPPLTPATIWNYLIQHSQSHPTSITSSSGPLHLQHVHASDFETGWDDAPQHLGEGASYSVRKHTLVRTDEKGGKQFVAVKKLNVSRAGDRAAEERAVGTILKELRILTHPPLWTHPSIVPLIGYLPEFSPENCGIDVSLVMAFAHHGTLREFLLAQAARTKGPEPRLPLLDRTHLAHDVVLGLEALHACGIIHGDLKLENVLVYDSRSVTGGRHTARLSDFGHAIVDLDSNPGIAGPYLGTLLYNAPEVRRGGRSSEAVRGADALRRCDVFSLGLLVWEASVLSGGRYYESLRKSTPGMDSLAEVVHLLDGLARDELLLKALVSLQDTAKIEGGEPWLVHLLSQVLQAALRDEPQARKSASSLASIFQRERAFSGDDKLDTIFSEGQLSMSPLAPLSFEKARSDSRLPQISSLDLPQTVQADLVAQLRHSEKTDSSSEERRLALYNLALCYLSGFGTDRVDTDQALALLSEAAQLGSSSALSLVFRLHEALGKEIPPSLWQITHPVVDLEKSLLGVESALYFTQRLRGLERVYQQELLRAKFDIIQHGTPIFSEVSLGDLEQSLQSDVDIGKGHSLECISHPQTADMPLVQRSLLALAARLGLVSLVDFLIKDTTPAQLNSDIDINDVLCAACQGGHLPVLKLLISHHLEPNPSNPTGTPLHFLNHLSPEDAPEAIELLTSSEKGKQCLMSVCTIQDSSRLSHFRASGTPLEIAIAANNAALVDELLLAVGTHSSVLHAGNGWTEDTYPLAVALNVSGMLEELMPYQVAYKLFMKKKASIEDKLKLSRKGKKNVPPMGLFDLVHPVDSLLPLLIHGAGLRSALETTVDHSVNLSLCYLNDEDEQGRTALSHVVYWAPCIFSIDVVSVLLSRGATFGAKETPLTIAHRIAQRHDHVAPELLRLFLNKGTIPLSTEIFFDAVHTGNVDVVRVLLGHEHNGTKIDINAPFAGEIDGVIHSSGVLPIAIAFISRPAAIIRLLLDHGADINDHHDGRTPLTIATESPHCDAETIDLLIERGANLWFPNGHSILHQAAYKDAKVNVIHVLFHLLRHERVRALINVPRSEEAKGTNGAIMMPVNVAVVAGNPGAVHALLQEGARVDAGTGGLAMMLKTAVDAGRRPHLFHAWMCDPADDEQLYEWRLKMEDIILAILSKGDPGHGRTRVHIATEIGNLRRLKELVEKGGYRVFVGDRDRRMPLAYLDLDALDDEGSDGNTKERDEWEKNYARDVKEIAEYLLQQTFKETNVSSVERDAESLEAFIANLPLSTDDPDYIKADVATLEDDLARLRLERDEAEISAGEGFESPADRAVEVRKVLENYRHNFGDNDLRTLRAMAGLADILILTEESEEAEAIQFEGLQRREATMPADDPSLIEAMIDRVCMLHTTSKFAKAREYSQVVVDRAVGALGEGHPLAIEARSKHACTLSAAGNTEAAIEIHEVALAGYRGLKKQNKERISSGRLLLGQLNLMVALLFDYCKMGRFDDAAAIATPEVYGVMLDSAGAASFYLAFDLVDDGIAKVWDMFGLYDLAESVHQVVVETCVKRHGQRKSYCINIALQRLAAHYRVRSKWEDQAKTLRRLVDTIKSTQGTNNEEYLAHMQELARALTKGQRWAEATLVGEQLLRELDTAPSQDQRAVIGVKTALCESLRGQKELEQFMIVGREAVADSQENFGHYDEVTLDVQRQLALTLMFREETAEAIDLLQSCVDGTIRIQGEIHHKTRQAVETLCTALMRARRMKEAEVQATRLLTIAREIPETSGAVVGSALHVMGVVKELAGEFKAAKKFYAECIEEEKAFHDGKHSISSLSTQRSLAKLHLETDDLDAAEALLNEILAESPPEYEVSHPEAVLFVHQYLGHIYKNANDSDDLGYSSRLDEAISHYEEAVRIARTLPGEDARTTYCIADLASALVDAGRYRESLPLSEEVLQYRFENLGEDDFMTIEAKKQLCNVYPPLRMWSEAQRVQEDVLDFLLNCGDSVIAEHGEPSWHEICAVLQALAQSEGKLGWSASAVKHQREVVELRSKHIGEENEGTLRAMVDLGFLLVDWGKTEEAEKLVTKLSKTCERVFAKDEDGYRKYMAEPVKASLYYQQDRLDEAMVVQRGILEREPGATDKLRFYMDILMKMEKYSEALETAEVLLLLLESSRHESGEVTRIANSEEDVELLVEMVEIYLKLEMPNEAERVGKQAVESVEGWITPLSIPKLELYISCLKALRPVYGALELANSADMTRLEHKIYHSSLSLKQRKDAEQAARKGREEDSESIKEGPPLNEKADPGGSAEDRRQRRESSTCVVS